MGGLICGAAEVPQPPNRTGSRSSLTASPGALKEMLDGLDEDSELYLSLTKATTRASNTENTAEMLKCRKIARHSSTTMDGEKYDANEGLVTQLRGKRPKT